MEAGERVNALGTKKLFPLIVSMSIPAICGNITTALYNVVDRLFVGQFVGRNALGAIGLMFPLNNVTSAITVLLTIGGGALISLSLGRKEKDKADEAFTNIVSMGAILAFIVTLFFFIFASQLISLCGARESSALHNPAVDYLRIIAIGQFFQIMNLGLAGAIRAEGNVRYSMVVSMIGALLNIGLDALFIIVFNAGLQGAAAATALSQVVGATVSALYFTREKSVLRWAGLKSVRFKKMLEIAGLGAAPAVFQGFGLVNNLITNNSLMIYGNNEMGAGGGDLAISALSVVNTVESIALMVVLGMNNAISTIISYNYGAKQYKRTRNAALIGQAIAFVICTVVWLMMMIVPKTLFAIFSSGDAQLAEYGAMAMRKSKMFMLFLGFQTLASMYFSAIGKPKVATFISIDKIIGRIYPLFGICLIVMAVGVIVGIFTNPNYTIPEIWTHFTNMHPVGKPIWSFMFITVACGAISGFHSTQSPLMARCMKSEKQGHFVFYGAMVAEGVIALIWAAAGCSIYKITGGLSTGLNDILANGQSAAIYDVCIKTMGSVGVALAMIGVIVCPITSGDTAFRSARLVLADWFKIDQDKIQKRLLLCVPLLAVGAFVGHLDYAVVWRYFSWTNQTLAMIVLWTASMYLFREKKNYWIRESSLIQFVFQLVQKILMILLKTLTKHLRLFQNKILTGTFYRNN